MSTLKDDEYNWDDHGVVVTTQDIIEVRDSLQEFKSTFRNNPESYKESLRLLDGCLDLCVNLIRQHQRHS